MTNAEEIEPLYRDLGDLINNDQDGGKQVIAIPINEVRQGS